MRRRHAGGDMALGNREQVKTAKSHALPYRIPIVHAATFRICSFHLQVGHKVARDALLAVMALCWTGQLLCMFLSKPARTLEQTACASRGRNTMLTPEQLQMLSRLVARQDN